MPRPLDLNLPRRRNWPFLAVAASVAVHVVVLLIGAIEARIPLLSPGVRSQPARIPPDTTFIAFEPPRPRTQPTGQRGSIAPERRRVERPEPRREAPEVLEPAPPEPQAPAVDSTPVTRRVLPRIGPGLAEGRLWVRPLPLPPKELAQKLSKSHTQLVDSAVTALVQAYLDSIAAEPANQGAELPSWTTTVAGKKFGIDSRNIYIAGLKIPAAVLALLPISAGNVDQNRAYNELMEMRSDLQRAAQRAENLAEFKDRIREIRLRKEREEEFARNQRSEPEGRDTVVAGEDGQPVRRSGGQ